MLEILLRPAPIRTLTKAFLRRFALGSYAFRLQHSAVERPHYGYIVYHAADLARRLDLPAVSVIEFGVAGGNGLLAMERHAAEATRLTGVRVDVYGFDRGEGLPDPEGYRDLPHYWQGGSYRMDVDQLRARLQHAELVLGDVAATAPAFLGKHAPIGAISFDLDFWSSTVAAMRILDCANALLPRVQCYFDDVTGGPLEAYSRFTGELLAIDEWNATHDSQKFDMAHNLLAEPAREPWHRKIRVFHSFEHPHYTRFISERGDELQLR